MLLLFGFYKYYPCGGMNDLLGNFESDDEINEYLNTRINSKLDYYQVYDTVNNYWYNFNPIKDGE